MSLIYEGRLVSYILGEMEWADLGELDWKKANKLKTNIIY